jgi:ACS family hexuronate transporter-like MFS transporter
MSLSPSLSAVRPEPGSLLSRRFTWVLVLVLLGSTTINYIDRQSLSVSAPVLREEFRLSNSDYAAILNAFMISYTIMYGVGGWVMDKLGIRLGLSLSVIWWSTASCLQAFARGAFSLGVYRSLLGMGEGGNWPAAAKAISMWVPRKMQSLAIGIANSGSSVGSAIAAPLIAWLIVHWGWRFAFLLTGTFGFFWLAIWLGVTHKLAKISPELATARPSVQATRISWGRLLCYRQTWSVFVCRFLADPIWYFYVFWMPEFLKRERGMELGAIGMVAWIPFVVADIANFASGATSGWLLHRGWSLNRTRKTIMAVSAIVCPFGVTAVFCHSIFWTIFFICLATFSIIFWAVTLHSVPMDFFPPEYVGSVFGFGGTGSSLGTVFTTWTIGWVLDRFHSYMPVFIFIGSLLPVAFVVGSLIMGEVHPLKLDTPTQRAYTSGGIDA